MISIKDYAKSRGISYEAARKSVSRHKTDLQAMDGIQTGTRGQQLLTDDAVTYLDEHRAGNSVIIQRRTERELQRLRNENAALREEIIALQYKKENAGDITGITVVFENTESANVKAEEIGAFFCGKIKKEYRRVAVNQVRRMDLCNEVLIELLPSANHYYDALMPTEERLFQRIMMLPDITSIHMVYDDGNREKLYPLWNSDDDYQNKYQTHILGKNGHLYIAINKKHDIAWYLKKTGIQTDKDLKGQKIIESEEICHE